MIQRPQIIFRSIFFVALTLLSACAGRQAEKRVPIHPARDPVTVLRLQMDRLFTDAAFENAFWGVAIQSLRTGEILYQQNSKKLLMPASNMKLLTAAAALKQLGPDFTFETQLKADGVIKDGILTGNLIIIGNGDPTISSRFTNGDSFVTFTDWAAKLKEKGISQISGDIIGMDDAFDDERIGYGWSWDDLPYYYATETAALQFAENAITVTLLSGETDTAVQVTKDPDTSYITVITDIQTQPGAETSINWSYRPEARTVYASGTLPLHGTDYGAFSISNPAAYFATAFKESLEKNGIPVTGSAYRGRDHNYTMSDMAELLFTHRSPPLRDILSVLLKVSQNLYAETLLKTLGHGKVSEGVESIERIMAEFGIGRQSLIVKDGSGLSRYNYVTPEALLHLLRRMYHERDFNIFLSALPVAGRDGTLRSRLKGTAAENNVWAKTGSLSNVRSLSGYTKTREGEMLAFVFIANNFNASNESAQAIQDAALQQLSNFSRSDRP